jgi:hypothetical protein
MPSFASSERGLRPPGGAPYAKEDAREREEDRSREEPVLDGDPPASEAGDVTPTPPPPPPITLRWEALGLGFHSLICCGASSVAVQMR